MSGRVWSLGRSWGVGGFCGRERIIGKVGVTRRVCLFLVGG